MSIKHLRRITLCLLTSALTVSHGQTATVEYTEPDFSNAEPVRMEILQSGGKRKLGARFVRPSANGVEIEMLDGDGSIIVGWDHMDQFTINIPMTESLERALAQSDPKRKVELLEDEIRPLLPLASIRSESTNVHILLNAYIKAVIDSEEWQRGFEMSQYMALNRSPAETVRHLYTVAENLFLVGAEAEALLLIDQLTAARPPNEFLRLGRGVADRMLEMRLFEPALRLYRTISKATSGLEKKKSLLTASFLSLELGATDEAISLLDEADAVSEIDAESNGLKYICLGVRAFKRGETDEALNHLGNGMAVLPTNSYMQQPGLYYTYLAYWNTERPEIAHNIRDEMRLLFPDGAYANILDQNTNK